MPQMFREDILQQEKKLFMHSICADETTQALAASFLTDWPYPEWIKGVQREGDQVRFVLLIHNEAYTRVFGSPLSQFRGKTDDAVWKSKRDLEAFRDLDIRALETESAVVDYEHATPLNHETPLGGLVRKWPVFDEYGQIKWIRGRCYEWKTDTLLWRNYCATRRLTMSADPWKRMIAPVDWRERSVIARAVLNQTGHFQKASSLFDKYPRR